MRLFMRTAARLTAAMLLMASSLAAAQTQPFPTKAVKVIVPTGAGGTTDIVARVIGQKLTELWGQAVLIDNRPGAGGTMGSEAIAKAAPDGYSLLWVMPSHMLIPILYPKLNYDPVKDFAPISMVTSVDLVLLVNPAVPANAVKELIALAKAKPGSLNIGVVDASLGYLASGAFRALAGIDIVNVPYKGVPQILQALVANEVQIFFVAPVTAIPQIRSGKLNGLAVTNARRLKSMPDMPTMQEAGVPGYDVVGWNGVLAPGRTSKKIINKIYADIARVLARPDMHEWMASQALELVGNKPEEFAAVIQADMAKWARMAAQLGLKPEQ